MITQELVEKLIDVVDQGLCYGIGRPIPGQMCVEAAVCYSMGLPHGDKPTCVLADIRNLKIALNDKSWSSNVARARGLRRLAVAQLGSTELDAKKFRERILDVVLRRVVPRALRSAAKVAVGDHSEKLEEAAKNCETNPDKEAVLLKAKNAVAIVTYTAASSAAYNAVSNVAYIAYIAVSNVAYIANVVANAADAYAYADKAAIRDKELATFAEEVVQVLVEMGTEGSKWLHLVPLES